MIQKRHARILAGLVEGMSKDEAVGQFLRAGMRWRVTQEDGESYFGTCDYDANRANLTINQGVVVTCTLG